MKFISVLELCERKIYKYTFPRKQEVKIYLEHIRFQPIKLNDISGDKSSSFLKHTPDRHQIRLFNRGKVFFCLMYVFAILMSFLITMSPMIRSRLNEIFHPLENFSCFTSSNEEIRFLKLKFFNPKKKISQMKFFCLRIIHNYISS